MSQFVCSADFESRSDVDLRKHGAGPYFASKRFMPLILCYSINGGRVKEWTCETPYCPEDIRAIIRGKFVISAFNASFERQCFDWLADNWGWPRPDFDCYRCSMATASALGLPRSLERLGDALNLEVKKDKIGASLIKFFCMPRSDGQFNEPADHPEKFAQFISYCRTDVETEMAAAKRMVPLSDDEQQVWLLDQRINARGIRIDRRSAVAAINLVEKAKALLDEEMRQVTRGAVPACTQVAKLTAWCEAQGVKLEGVAKDDILEALDLEDLPADVRRALTIRQEAGKSSTSKLKSFIAHAGADDRVRGSFVYHGASPGRWSNVGVNFANLPRPRAVYDNANLDAAQLFAAFRREDPTLLRTLYGEELGKPLHLVSDAIRGFILAAPGHDLIAVDYSGIQSALSAWFADETWKLQAMREIIADPTLPDLYRRAAAGILNTTTEIITKKHWGRQLGKVGELACTFGGSVAAYVSMAANYGLKKQALHDLYGPVWAAATEDVQEKSIKRYEACCKSRDKKKTDVLSREGWLACYATVTGWRNTNPAHVKLWADLEAAMRDALRNPGVAQHVSKLTYLFARGALWCRLPSGRCICYNAPRLRDQVWAKMWVDLAWTEAEVVDREEAQALELKSLAKIQGPTSPRVTALGVSSTTQKLERYALYGGMAVENTAMGAERDILVAGLRNCERAGYPIVFHTYDEGVAEVPRGFGSVAEMEKLMLDLPSVYATLPLDAHGWRGKRNRK